MASRRCVEAVASVSRVCASESRYASSRKRPKGACEPPDARAAARPASRPPGWLWPTCSRTSATAWTCMGRASSAVSFWAASETVRSAAAASAPALSSSPGSPGCLRRRATAAPTTWPRLRDAVDRTDSEPTNVASGASASANVTAAADGRQSPQASASSPSKSDAFSLAHKARRSTVMRRSPMTTEYVPSSSLRPASSPPTFGACEIWGTAVAAASSGAAMASR
mmetsp:Transcript_25724/g.87971  ORF Transcript_25724/g.87971 Transcript_25724/m.87971 type:complete len:225 (-) Transcript_25724:686-1360(-)